MTEEPRPEEERTISPLYRIMIALVVFVTGGVGFATGRIALRPAPEVRQPIAFNHQKHTVELELECTTCHQYLSVGRHAGLPTLETCLECHEDALTDSPEEAKIRELSGEGKTNVFKKLFRLPDHAYYSHRRHAVVAKLACGDCHGAIAETTTPPTRPLVRINMQYCIDCHARESVNTGCTSCHH